MRFGYGGTQHDSLIHLDDWNTKHGLPVGIPERPTVQRNLLQALMSGMGKVLIALLTRWLSLVLCHVSCPFFL